jgi:hypothetical protein
MDQSHLHTTNPTHLTSILDLYGVAILDNYFTKEFAKKFVKGAIKWLINLDIGLTRDKKTWNIKNTPLGPRYGMYQSIISHYPKFWKLREELYHVFTLLYDDFELVTSIDGASVYPPKSTSKTTKDWAHIDQTINSNSMCYQSQLVCTDSTATFVATVGSHLKHKQILKEFGIEASSTNWHKFTDDQVTHLKKMFGDSYQTPIIASPGSIIFWDSRTIHSAKYQDPGDTSWRGVFYISMRPLKSVPQRNLNTIKRAAIEGRTTNHWGSRMFGTSDRYKQKNEKVMKLMRNLGSLSYVSQMSDLQLKLVGLMEY